MLMVKLTVMDPNGDTIYKVSQLNMVSHGIGHFGLNVGDIDEGQVPWVRLHLYPCIHYHIHFTH